MPEVMGASFAPVERDTARAAIAAGGAMVTATGRTAPDAPVPPCPGWTVATVMKHLALVHQWAAGLLRDYPNERPTFPSAPRGMSNAELADWADEQREVFLAALEQSDGDRTVWAFGEMRPARFWWRRQAIETVIHAVDATAAAGTPWAIPDEVGAEGVEEAMDWNLSRVFASQPSEWGAGKTIHFHRTDGDGEWLLTIGNPPTVARGHAKGDLAVRGPAAQLLLWVWNRPAEVELFGDTALAEGWAANLKV